MKKGNGKTLKTAKNAFAKEVTFDKGKNTTP
jgi:hypothetical protein